jgi:hypothetical protein
MKSRPKTYSEASILLILTLKCLYRLPLRAAQGFVSGLFKALEIGLSIPHDTTLSRRQKDCDVPLPCRQSKEPFHLVLEATGLKVYGEGGWKVRIHGVGKGQTWCKIHLGIDERTGHIDALCFTKNNIKDSHKEDYTWGQTKIPMAKDNTQDSSRQR